MSNKSKKLTAKEQRFCEEYLIDLNGTQAAIRSGYSPASARVIAHENLTKPYIQAYIEAAQKAIFLQLGITQERILREYARLAFSDIRKLYDESSRLKAIHTLDDDSAAILAGVEVDQLWETTMDGQRPVGETKKVKIWDKKGALDSLAKYFGMLPDRVDVTSKGKELKAQTSGPRIIKATLKLT